MTKWVEADAIPDKRAKTVAKFILKQIISRYGIFDILQSDQGLEFNNAVVNKILKRSTITHKLSSTYHLQTNRLTEKIESNIISCFAKYVDEKGDDWDEYVEGVLFAYRTSLQESTRFTPYELLFGRKARFPVEWQFKPNSKEQNDPCTAEITPPNVFEISSKALLNIKKVKKSKKRCLTFEKMSKICFKLEKKYKCTILLKLAG